MFEKLELINFGNYEWGWKKVKVQVAQLCPTLFNLMDCSPQAPLSMGFSKQEYSSPGEPRNPDIKPRSPALKADSYHVSHQGGWTKLFSGWFWLGKEPRL